MAIFEQFLRTNSIFLMPIFKPNYSNILALGVIERIAWWIMMLQMPIYLAQKDAVGGLGWEQSEKGVLFMIWALVQNTTPVFMGGYADKFGRFRAMGIGGLICSLSYFLMPIANNFWTMLIVCVLLGFGAGIAKPAIYGSLAVEAGKKSKDMAWAGFHFAINTAAFFVAAPLSKYLKNIDFSFVFYSSAFFALLFAIYAFIIKDDSKAEKANPNSIPRINFSEIITDFLKPKSLLLIIGMSGFTITYMQFYETLPHYIYDWSDTSNLSSILPQTMLMELRGVKMLSYEWFYNINTGLTILLIFPLIYFLRRFKGVNVLILASSLSGLGLALSWFGVESFYLLTGLIIYTFGEIIANPKFNEEVSSLAGDDEKSKYLGFSSFSWTLGLSGGALIGGLLYGKIAEKSSLALKYANDNAIIISNPNIALIELASKLHQSEVEATKMLFELYQPNNIMLPFIAFSMLGIVALIAYSRLK